MAADRPIAVRDLLTFRGSFGMILASPSEYPILEAEQALERSSVGPPTPVTPHGPGEWLRRMGTLPLMVQPGGQWRYSTGSQILGVLIARAAGQPVESFYRQYIFDPLGMTDTGFQTPATELHRLVPCYLDVDGGLEPFDDDDQWSRPTGLRRLRGRLGLHRWRLPGFRADAARGRNVQTRTYFGT